MPPRRMPIPGGRDPLAVKPGKYTPLGLYLARLPEEQRCCEMEFRQIEQMVGRQLPQSARTNWFWHKDEPASHARAWLDYGWRGELIGGDCVRFLRLDE